MNGCQCDHPLLRSATCFCPRLNPTAAEDPEESGEVRRLRPGSSPSPTLTDAVFHWGKQVRSRGARHAPKQEKPPNANKPSEIFFRMVGSSLIFWVCMVRPERFELPTY